jgi:hypothetical protein
MNDQIATQIVVQLQKIANALQALSTEVAELKSEVHRGVQVAKTK